MLDIRFLIFLLAVVLCLPGAHSSLDHPEWKNYKNEHGKTYMTLDEEMLRNEIFIKNLKRVEEHNQRYDQGLETYAMKMNEFGDLTEEEFLEMMTSSVLTNRTELLGEVPASCNTPPSSLPGDMDWRRYGAVTGVKNQGSCGSCWAFSVIGAVECLGYKTRGRAEALSEQHLMDCCQPCHPGDHGGCNGGYPDQGIDYIGRHGINSQSRYPYKAKNDHCHSSNAELLFKGIKSHRLPARNEAALQCAVAKICAISVIIELYDSFQFYSHGVYYEPKCRETPFHNPHAVLVVGYGRENGNDYWLVKNSWGSKWGENGYIKMARNRGNNCGIATYARYPSY